MDTLNTIVTIAISLASLIVAIAALRVAKQSIEVGLYPMRKEVMKSSVKKNMMIYFLMWRLCLAQKFQMILW